MATQTPALETALGKRIWRLADFMALLLVLLTLRIVYWQLVREELLQPLAVMGSYSGDEGDGDLDRQALQLLSGSGAPVDLKALPQPLVQRMADLLSQMTRGAIYDRNGRMLAYDTQDRQRIYTQSSLGQVTGYLSGLRIGVSGLERSYNTFLFGLHRLDTQIDRILKAPIQGSDLILTIDSALQQAAASALQGQNGAILVLDGKSGAILAMASEPGFDPNRMLDEAYTTALVQDCGAPACRAPLLNRATQALYAPGSTWKTLTLIAGLDTGQLQPGMIFDFGRPFSGPGGTYYVYEVDGGIIPDPNHKESRLTLEMSYAKSANAAFARIGDEMPADTLIDYATRLGLNKDDDRRFPLEIAYSEPQLAYDLDSLHENNLLRASTAIGQGELLVTPLSMGRVILAVLNDGNLPLPYLVDSIRDPSGELRAGLLKGRRLQNLMSLQTAQEVKRMLQIVVQEGSGRKAQVPGLVTGGKTGTAQLDNNQSPHAWFVGFAETGERSVVIVVLVENGGEGSQTAAPIFASLAQEAMQSAGQPVQAPQPTPASPTPEPTPTPGQAPPETGAGALTPDIPYAHNQIPFFEKSGSSCPGRGQELHGSGEFTWPSAYQSLSGTEFRRGHPGIDLGAPNGTPVYAADAGIVVFAGWSGNGYGNTIVIDHRNGFWTLYAHLSQVSTHCGAGVEKGERIGMSGSTGNSPGEHLHFEVRVVGGYLDPIKMLPVPR